MHQEYRNRKKTGMFAFMEPKVSNKQLKHGLRCCACWSVGQGLCVQGGVRGGAGTPKPKGEDSQSLLTKRTANTKGKSWPVQIIFTVIINEGEGLMEDILCRTLSELLFTKNEAGTDLHE